MLHVTQRQRLGDLSPWLSNSSLLPVGHSHFPFSSGWGQEQRLPRQCCSQGIIAIHHSLLGKCKCALADGDIIYCHRLGCGLGQEWPLAKHYFLAPLGGWAVWAELGWKGGKGQGQGFAAQNRVFACCHNVRVECRWHYLRSRFLEVTYA